MSSGPLKLKKKICLLGAFGVGKTSLVRAFVHSIFSEEYLSTIGVQISEKTVRIGCDELKLMLWDIAGEEEFFQIPSNYVAGAAGYLLVVDGTRPETLETALEVKERVDREVGDLPCLLLFNKSDRVEDWNLSEERIDAFRSDGWICLRTSAKTGENVEQAFSDLAARLI
jgi:small GTP-binding protein